MDRIWLKNYPPGVPTDIDPDQYGSLTEMFAKTCAAYGNLPAYTNMGATLSFAQLDELSRAFAAWLQRKSGLTAGDRVALMMPNILQYPIALFGVLRAGMVVVNTNPLYTARELEHQLKDSGAKAHRRGREFCARGPASAAAYRSQKRAGDPHRRFAGIPTRRDREFRAAPRAQAGSGLAHARRRDIQERARGGFGIEARSRRARTAGYRVPAIYRRHHRSGQGGDSYPSQYDRQRAAGERLDQTRAAIIQAPQCASDRHHGAAALPHLLAHGELPAFSAFGRPQHIDHQPARFLRASSPS